MRYNSPNEFLRELKTKMEDEILFKEISNYITNMELGREALGEIIDELQRDNDHLYSELQSCKIKEYNKNPLNRIK